MNALINRENMKLLHIHTDANLLCNLAWIECHCAAYYVLSLQDATAFKVFTSMELQILYKNLTGAEGVKFNRSQLIQVIWDLCNRVKASDVDPIEADAQAELIKEDDPNKWVYVKGATRPGRKSDLYEHKERRARVSTVEEDMALKGRLPALEPAMGTLIAPVHTTTTRPATKQRRSKAPKSGTLSATIWEAADNLWESLGKPTSKTELAEMKKVLVSQLEAQGINKSTARTQAGHWQKTILPL